jgi:NAD(P)-dependent dehydrogenase (short-subunit alcohol dehydrogenase family)
MTDPGPLPLAGRAALVTGGGSGIGLACARRLLLDGASVTLMGRRADRLEAAAGELAGDTPDGATVATHAGDVSDEGAVEAAVTTATTATGGLDVAVLAAGQGTLAPLLVHELSQWQQVLDVNLTGAFLGLKHAGAAMARSGGGSIVAISSIASPLTHRFMTAYCVSKAAVDALVRNAADELGVAGIRVNSVRPGLVPTELAGPLAGDDQVREDYLAQMPVRRLGTVDDVAAAVRWFAGPESGWVTGECLGVDGGHHLRRGPDVEPWARALFGDDVAEGRLG